MTACMLRLVKLTVAVAAALLCFGLVRDWVAPGEGTHQAALALGLWGDDAVGVHALPLWSALVRAIGWNAWGLGALSVAAGLVGAFIVYLTGEVVFAHVVWRMELDRGVEGDTWQAHLPASSSMIAAGAYLASVLPDGFSPLTTWALAPLLGLYCIALALTGRRWTWVAWIAAVLLIEYGIAEGLFARRCLVGMVLSSAMWFVLLGVLPLVTIANLTYWRKCVVYRGFRWPVLAVWMAGVVIVGGMRFATERGRVAARLVETIVANAAEAGRAAVVSDGTLDDLLAFELPDEVRLISLAREQDPAYGIELGEWVREKCNVEIWKYENGVSTTNYQLPTTNLVEELSFAAELGPRALIDKWAKLDRAELDKTVATEETWFPTRAKWEAACAGLVGMRSDEPLAAQLRHLLGVCGNALGCRLIEEGDEKGAWDVFWKISEEVDRDNYATLLNLVGLAERGLDVPGKAKETVRWKRAERERWFKNLAQLVSAARYGGQLYVDPEAVARFERERREQAAKRGLSPEAKAFAETLAAAPRDPASGRRARDAIYRALQEGKVRLDRIGGSLIALDFALGDVKNAERDAIDVLKLDDKDPAANAAIGSLAGARGDYERAERYLRRAIATGRASVVAKNDLAYVLCRKGALEEAEALAREAVRVSGDAWSVRETLAAILIRGGKLDEGERELSKAVELAAKAGAPKGTTASLDIDRARLYKEKGDTYRFKVAMRQLKSRKELTEEQREEVRGME